jgi:hypothetical protein
MPVDEQVFHDIKDEVHRLHPDKAALIWNSVADIMKNFSSFNA